MILIPGAALSDFVPGYSLGDIMWVFSPKCDLCGKIGDKAEYKTGETLVTHNENDFVQIGITSSIVDQVSKAYPANSYKFLCDECSRLPLRDVLQELAERE